MFKTQAGSMNPEEIKKLMEVIKLYSTGKTLKSKSGVPETHQAKSLKAKNNDWKMYLKHVPDQVAEKNLTKKFNKRIFGGE